MLKLSIIFTDYNDIKRTEDLYFNLKETNGEKEMENYKYHYCRATDVDLVLSDRTWLMDKIKYLQGTVIPSIEEEVDRRDKVLADWKEEFPILRKENAELKKENKGFEEEITKLKLDIERKNERIKELIIDNDDLYAVNTALHEEIERSKLIIKGTPLSEVKKEVFKQYCMNDIAITKLCYEESAYIKIARHIRSKYNALVKAGFSHDDAMSLIPMWTDDCEVNNAD